MAIEHEISIWHKLDKTWEVTHKKQRNPNTNLFDVAKDFKSKFKTRFEAEKYAIILFLKNAKEGHNLMLNSLDGFGQESTAVGFGGGHCWTCFVGHKWFWKFEDGTLTINNLPEWMNTETLILPRKRKNGT